MALFYHISKQRVGWKYDLEMYCYLLVFSQDMKWWMHILNVRELFLSTSWSPLSIFLLYLEIVVSPDKEKIIWHNGGVIYWTQEKIP